MNRSRKRIRANRAPALLFLLLIAFPALAADITGRALVPLKDGSQAYVFLLNNYDRTRDGEIYVIVTSGGTRTAYKPQENILDAPAQKGSWGVKLRGDVQISMVEVVLYGNPPAPVSAPVLALPPALAGKWTLSDRMAGALTLKLEAEGDAAKGYTLTGKASVKDAGEFAVTGTWNPAKPSAPLIIETSNVFKQLLEGLLGQSYPADAFSLGEKITAIINLPTEWTAQLKKGIKSQDDLKAFSAGQVAVGIAVPFTLKIDPTKPAFNLMARINPVAKTVSLSLGAGQKWDKPFDFLPVSFDQIALTTDFKFESLNAKAAGNIEFFGLIPVDLDMITLKGMKPDLKLTIKPDVNILIGALGKLEIPVELKDIFLPVLNKLEFGTFNLGGLGDLGISGKLPSLKMDFKIKTLHFDRTFNLDMPEFSFRKPALFIAELGKIVLPELKANFDIILADLAFDGLIGKWTLADLSIDVGSIKVTAEGDPMAGYDLACAITVKDVGTMNAVGKWSPAAPLAPVTFHVDNIFKSAFEGLLGGAYPSEAFSLDEKIDVTVGLDPNWVEQLKKGSKGATTIKTGTYTLVAKMPFKLKLDPMKPMFNLTATIDAVAKTVAVGLDEGQKWDQPFDFLPVTFDKIDLTSDFKFESLNAKAAGNIEFFGAIPASLDMITLKGMKPDLKLTIKPDVNILIGALGKLDIPIELKDIFIPLLDKFEFGAFELGGIGDLGISGKLPSLKMDFKLKLPNFEHTFKLDMPEFNFRKPDLFTAELGKIVLPVLQANLPDITMGLALELATGKWPLVDLNIDLVKLKLDAEGDPTKGFTLDGVITVKDLGDFKVNGLWGKDDPSKVVFDVDNAAQSVLDATIGKAVPKDWFKMGDKITVTATLDKEWSDQLTKGAKAANPFDKGNFTVDISFPLTLKFDPTKDAFKLTAHIDPQAKTATIGLDAGQTWSDPFGYLPVTFTQIDMASDVKFSKIAMTSTADMTFIKPIPLKLDATIANGAVTNFKLIVTPPADFPSAVLNAMKIPGNLSLSLDDVKWALDEILKNIKMGEITISAPDFNAKVADIGLKFSVDLPSWKYDFDFKAPGVNLKNLDKFYVDFGNYVVPVLVANFDKITAGLIFKGIAGKWPLGDVDLGIASANLEAEGDPTKGYTLTGKITVVEAGDFTINGFWSPSTPLDPINFKADNLFKTAMDKRLDQLVPKDWIKLDEKINIKVGLSESWVNKLQRGGRADAKTPAAGGDKFTLEVSMPLKMILDPKKPPFNMTASYQPLNDVISLSLDDGQVWEKPLDILPVRFDKLALGADPSLTTLTVNTSGKLDFLVPCDVVLVMETKKGAAPSYTVNLKPAAGTNIVKAILDGRVPPASLALVNGLLPNTVVEEISVAMDATKSKPDIRLKFTMSKESLSQTFDILVKEADMSNSGDFSAKAAPQILDQLSGGTIGAATTELLDKLGLSGDWTIIDLNIASQLILKVNVKGSPAKGYDITSDIKPLVFDQFKLTGRWDPAKPADPVTLTADKNVFKPVFDKTIGKQLPTGWMVLKDELFVVITFPSAITDALTSGGSAGAGATTGADGIDMEIGFPMELKIDPTKEKRLDMIGSVLPMKSQAQLALAAGQVWDKPFGFVPATFNTFTAASDPSFTQITIHGEGTSDFLEGEKIDFKIDIVSVQGQKPTLEINATPTPGMAKAMMKKANIPASLQDCIATIELNKIDMSADFSSVINGVVPYCKLSFTLNHPLAGRLNIDVGLPAGDMKDPAGFAKTVAENVVSQLENIVSQVVGNVSKKLENAAKDPVGTAKDLANTAGNTAQDIAASTKDFFKDPGRNTVDLAKNAAKMAEDLGKQVVSNVTAKLEKIAEDPIGAAIEAAQAAYDAAVSVANSIADFFSDIGSAIVDFFGGGDDGPSDEEIAAQEAADKAKADAQKKLNDLYIEQMNKRIAEILRNADFENCKKAIAAATTMQEAEKIAYNDFQPAYSHLLNSDKTQLYEEVKKKAMSIAPPPSESMAWWRNKMSDAEIWWLDDGIKFIDGKEFPNNTWFSNVSGLSAADKAALKSEMKAKQPAKLLKWQTKYIRDYREGMDWAFTIQDVLNQIEWINNDIMNRLNQDQVADLKKYADAAIARVNAAWLEKFTDQINGASTEYRLYEVQSDMEISYNLTAPQKAVLKKKIAALLPNIKTQGPINAMRNMEKRIAEEMNFAVLKGLDERLTAGPLEMPFAANSVEDVITQIKLSHDDALDADLSVLSDDSKEILGGLIRQRIYSLRGIHDAVVNVQLKRISNMMLGSEIELLSYQIDGRAAPDLSYLGDDNKKKLRDEIQKRFNQAPIRQKAFDEMYLAIDNAATWADLTKLQDALSGKSVEGLPVILNLTELDIERLTERVTEKLDVINTELKKFRAGIAAATTNADIKSWKGKIDENKSLAADQKKALKDEADAKFAELAAKELKSMQDGITAATTSADISTWEWSIDNSDLLTADQKKTLKSQSKAKRIPLLISYPFDQTMDIANLNRWKGMLNGTAIDRYPVTLDYLKEPEVTMIKENILSLTADQKAGYLKTIEERLVIANKEREEYVAAAKAKTASLTKYAELVEHKDHIKTSSGLPDDIKATLTGEVDVKIQSLFGAELDGYMATFRSALVDADGMSSEKRTLRLKAIEDYLNGYYASLTGLPNIKFMTADQIAMMKKEVALAKNPPSATDRAAVVKKYTDAIAAAKDEAAIKTLKAQIESDSTLLWSDKYPLIGSINAKTVMKLTMPENVKVGKEIRLNISGGWAPFKYELERNRSGASFVGDVYKTGSFATAMNEMGNIIVVTDATGQTQKANVRTIAGITVSPSGKTSVMAGGSITFTAPGGVGTPSFSLDPNNSNGFINEQTGVYTAGTGKSNVEDGIKARDFDFNSDVVTVFVYPKPTAQVSDDRAKTFRDRLAAANSVEAAELVKTELNADTLLTQEKKAELIKEADARASLPDLKEKAQKEALANFPKKLKDWIATESSADRLDVVGRYIFNYIQYPTPAPSGMDWLIDGLKYYSDAELSDLSKECSLPGSIKTIRGWLEDPMTSTETVRWRIKGFNYSDAKKEKLLLEVDAWVATVDTSTKAAYDAKAKAAKEAEQAAMDAKIADVTAKSEMRISITSLYQSILYRAPTAMELANNEGYFASFGLADIANSLLTSDGFKNLSAAEKIKSLYRFILRRDADADGTAYYGASGKSTAEIAKALYESDEHKKLAEDKKTLIKDVLTKYGVNLSASSAATTTAMTTATSYTPSATNLAKGKSASGSAACGTSEGPEKAVNGTSSGGNSDKWCSLADQKYLDVDLGASYSITEFVVAHAGAGSEDASFNTKDFSFSVSADKTTWTDILTVSGNTSNVTKHAVQGTGQYVRLNIKTPTQTTDKAARIYEFEVNGTIVPAVSNLAKGKTATGSASCASSEGPEKAVNGSKSDKWCSKADQKFLEVDLGAPYSITEFVVAHAAEGGEGSSYNTKDFKISVSADKSSWTESVNVSGNTSNLTKHAVTNTTGQYVKLTITTPTQTADPAARIYEFEVIGR
ncbi:MAG: hypothetical protein A3G34_00415 [Candidatus Lindowbacteria bacterium RIFCSPLOWO2_12_FULL_62_27]|nr:MAG: hypothetical protein A3G34_00415 [Candidatus Lindowbacteria bacterium RIFCSPLOWO2_12_FULL_62_27]OGH63411.1 MAG: hypothetical protein A3I06_08495 [Candidatus Lindowbacteria bacterium RIFCSPLOWO2_02_FULL_62_12]